MLTDYKFWYIRRDDDGFIEEAAVRFYEGEITTKNERDNDDNLVPVTKYRRSRRLGKNDLKHLDHKFVKESSGADAKLYTRTDFGTIKTDDELRAFLNSELAKNKGREPIEEQKWLR